MNPGGAGPDFAKICAAGRTDTIIYIVRKDTDLCAGVLRQLRAPGALSSRTSTAFEAGWRLYLAMYADSGGPFGILIHPRMRQRAPVLAMGQESLDVPCITAMLAVEAREITRGALTPIICEREFQSAVESVVAELTETAGCA